MESEQRESWWDVPAYKTAIIGIAVIIIASIVKLVFDWITIPLSVTSFKEFYNVVVYSFSYVLNFEFKLWWVFLLIIYMAARFRSIF